MDALFTTLEVGNPDHVPPELKQALNNTNSLQEVAGQLCLPQELQGAHYHVLHVNDKMNGVTLYSVDRTPHSCLLNGDSLRLSNVVTVFANDPFQQHVKFDGSSVKFDTPLAMARVKMNIKFVREDRASDYLVYVAYSGAKTGQYNVFCMSERTFCAVAARKPTQPSLHKTGTSAEVVLAT